MNEIAEEDALEVLEGAWSTMLDLTITPVDNPGMKVKDYYSAEIRISGAWEGSVQLRASIAFLSHAASVMFDTSPDDVSDADRIDTLAELTNMLGGTMKCLLPEPSELSLPSRVDESDGNREVHSWLSFHCDDLPLQMALTPSSQSAKAAA